MQPARFERVKIPSKSHAEAQHGLDLTRMAADVRDHGPANPPIYIDLAEGTHDTAPLHGTMSVGGRDWLCNSSEFESSSCCSS
jgi:hypothetical protein